MLRGVVDWSGAGHGPRELDPAWCRQDLVLLGSVDAAERLAEAYAAAAGTAGRPEVDAAVLRRRLDAWIADLGVTGTWQG